MKCSSHAADILLIVFPCLAPCLNYLSFLANRTESNWRSVSSCCWDRHTLCGLDDGCYSHTARDTVSRHSLIGCTSSMHIWAWQCCKQTYLHEVSSSLASP